MSSNSISWTQFCQGMNSIAYWLLQNKKKYKKRDYYQILKLKGSCADVEKRAKKLGYNAVSLTGWQIPIKTNEKYGDADILKINLNRITKELALNKIVVVAGFQGINEKTGNITTLGRGGSDTTAVAIAAAIKAAKCDIYKDVDGVYNIDPKTNKNAFKYDKISYDEMLDLSNNGAKVLHNKSVVFAKKYNVPIHIKSIYNENSLGTHIC